MSEKINIFVQTNKLNIPNNENLYYLLFAILE